jgi:DNA repair protein RadC
VTRGRIHSAYAARERARVGVRHDCQCHSLTNARTVARSVAEEIEPYRPPEVEPVLMAASSGSKCRPFLRVEKDPQLFAACNAIADEIGPLDDPERAYRLIEQVIGNEVNEVFGLVTVDLHKRMKSIAETGRGEPASVMAPMVPTLQAALIDGAYGVIIFHVHPSGVEAQPSKADKDTTKAFAKAFDTVGVFFIDHIIVGGDVEHRSYYSFVEAGAL